MHGIFEWRGRRLFCNKVLVALVSLDYEGGGWYAVTLKAYYGSVTLRRGPQSYDSVKQAKIAVEKLFHIASI